MATKSEKQQQNRPEYLKFVAGYLPDGRPVRYFPDIPARDLLSTEIAQLTEEQLLRAMNSGLYEANSTIQSEEK